ncbi:MAG: 3-deoxy-D-manno-octulosonic acid transferase [Betaproteobacteria bacterium]|nr:3-deoxy-D-manno-octulosonic acid transferase [Betaproteobacteria bacterium]
MVWLALPFALLRLLLRARREPRYRQHVRERFGIHSQPADRPVIWVHAVSLGEARASLPLARALLARHPDAMLLATCMTAAGREALEQAWGRDARIVWLPWDTPSAVRRFLAFFRPRLAVLMETEVWFNLVAGCKAHGVPVVLANARMSEKSAHGYAMFGALSTPAFSALDAVCAQGEADARRLRALGARSVEVHGNLKFDLLPDSAKAAEGARLKRLLGVRPVLLAASTREGEEAALLDALGQRAAKGHLLVIVPRHPRRFDEVADLVTRRGLALARRSAAGEGNAQTEVLLGDTMGEMALYFALADVVVMGGSVLAYGSQNLIEPLAQGVPVVLGPSDYNFSEASVAAREAGAAVQAVDAAGVIDAALSLLADEPRRRHMGQAGMALCAAHRGATARQLEVIDALYQRSSPS